MKNILSAMLCVSILSHAFAQKLPSVSPLLLQKHSRYTLELEHGNKLLIYAPSIQSLENFQNLDSILTFFVRDYKTIKPSLNETINGRTAIYRALEKGQFQLDLTEHEAKKQRFSFEANRSEPLLLKTVQDTLLITQNYSRHLYQKDSLMYNFVTIVESLGSISTYDYLNTNWGEYVYFCLVINNLEDVEAFVKNGTTNAHIKKAIQDAKQYPHHNLQNDKYQFNYHINNTGGNSFQNVGLKRGDFLAIHQSFGVGVFRNQLVPNSQTEISLVPNKYKNKGYTLGWRSMFWTSRDEQTGRWRTNSNGVLQAGITFYDFNTSTKSSRIDTDHVLFGVYLGRVMTRNGDIFERNTWNFSMTVAARGMVKIQPEVYFNGFFSRNVMPSLRIQVGF